MSSKTVAKSAALACVAAAWLATGCTTLAGHASRGSAWSGQTLRTPLVCSAEPAARILSRSTRDDTCDPVPGLLGFSVEPAATPRRAY